ncbi:hypothetical protein HanIR_Chr01g0040311 [Helianthus annuus]|nr:hypothetical protein HanIR_Chr01g0040311 [Helianthus annuus]
MPLKINRGGISHCHVAEIGLSYCHVTPKCIVLIYIIDIALKGHKFSCMSKQFIWISYHYRIQIS